MTGILSMKICWPDLTPASPGRGRKCLLGGIASPPAPLRKRGEKCLLGRIPVLLMITDRTNVLIKDGGLRQGWKRQPGAGRACGRVERGGDRRKPPQPRDRKPVQVGYSGQPVKAAKPPLSIEGAVASTLRVDLPPRPCHRVDQPIFQRRMKNDECGLTPAPSPKERGEMPALTLRVDHDHGTHRTTP